MCSHDGRTMFPRLGMGLLEQDPSKCVAMTVEKYSPDLPQLKRKFDLSQQFSKKF